LPPPPTASGRKRPPQNFLQRSGEAKLSCLASQRGGGGVGFLIYLISS